jgi:hypothetical protein
MDSIQTLAKKVMTLPDSGVVDFARQRCKWAVPSPDHLRLALAIRANHAEDVRTLLARAPHLIHEGVTCPGLENLGRRAGQFRAVAFQANMPPLSLAVASAAWQTVHGILDAPGVDVNDGVHQEGRGFFPSPLFFLMLALPLRPIPDHDTEAGRVAARLLDMGADPLIWEHFMHRSPMARALQALSQVPHDLVQGANDLAFMARLIDVVMTRQNNGLRPPPDFSPVSEKDPSGKPVPEEKNPWSDFCTGLFERMTHDAHAMAQDPEAFGLVSRLQRGREITGIDLPAWPDMLLAWLVREGLGRRPLDAAIRQHPAVGAWIEQQWLGASVSAQDLSPTLPRSRL